MKTPLLVVLTLAALACSDGAAKPTSIAGRYTTDAAVEEHGPSDVRLCLGVTLTSLPPSCSGVPLVGWNWDKVDGEQSAGEVRWGGPYRIVGNYDGKRFEVTEIGPAPSRSPEPPVVFPLPCPEPVEGWPAVPPRRGEQEPHVPVMQYARSLPDHAANWLSSPVTTRDGRKLQVHVFAVTRDVERHAAEFKSRYSGPLCVTQLERTLAFLEDAQMQSRQITLDSGLRWFNSSTDELRGTVEVGVDVADRDVQADLDRRFGQGVVLLKGRLTPA